MSKSLWIALNKSGVRELMDSKPIMEACKEQADAVAAKAGDGYAVEARNYPDRKGYAVRPVTWGARQDNLKHNTLLKALNK